LLEYNSTVVRRQNHQFIDDVHESSFDVTSTKTDQSISVTKFGSTSGRCIVSVQ
jgi:hypothetical protein